MNKYQEAINELKYALIEGNQTNWTIKEKKRLIDTLQELINTYTFETILKYEEIMKEDTATILKLEQQIRTLEELIEKYSKLEKALDEACEKLDIIKHSITLLQN